MKRFIALLLCFALMLPVVTPVKAESLTTEKTEILSKRDIYSKTYVLADGTYQYVSYAEPVHYKDSTGAYLEIDNKITSAVKRDSYKYTNTSNGWNAHFSEKLDNSNAVALTSGEYEVAFSLVEQTGGTAVMKATALPLVSAKSMLSSAYHQKLSADDRAVIYSNVAENVDIAYTVQTGALKEDIILRSRQTPSVYKFRLATNGLTLRESGGSFGLFTSTGEEMFTFAPLYMEDANGKRSENVSLTYTSVKNGYELTVSADTEFLNAADTVYPVVIDPSIMVTGSGSTYDTCVDQQYPYSNYYLSENLWTGGAYGTNAMRTYMKFIILTDILPRQVTSAHIYLLKKEYQTPTIKAYRVTEEWASSAITWNSQPACDETAYSSAAVNTVGDWYGLDVTDIVKSWLGDGLPNYGVVLKEPAENNSTQKTKFYSSDAPSPNKPELVINYEPYYGSRPYQSISEDNLGNVNCMGYALEYEEFLTPSMIGINEAMMDGMSVEEVEGYFYQQLELWMDLHIGTSNWSVITDQNSNIHENWYRVYCQIGFANIDHDDIFDECEGEDGDESFTFHWMYQTSTGLWATKAGAGITSTTDLTADHLTATGGQDEYTSTFLFFQIRDIRTVDW